jgi:hypothetical protein
MKTESTIEGVDFRWLLTMLVGGASVLAEKFSRLPVWVWLVEGAVKVML